MNNCMGCGKTACNCEQTDIPKHSNMRQLLNNQQAESNQPVKSHREAFEALISRQPYNKTIRRFTAQDGVMWEGEYMSASVQLAWEVWQEAQK